MGLSYRASGDLGECEAVGAVNAQASGAPDPSGESRARVAVATQPVGFEIGHRAAAHAVSLGHVLRVPAYTLAGPSKKVPELVDLLLTLLPPEGPDVLSGWEEPLGDLLWLRRQIVAVALSRLRTLEAETGRGRRQQGLGQRARRANRQEGGGRRVLDDGLGSR